MDKVDILNYIGYRILNISTIFINAALARDNIHQIPSKEWKRFKTEDPYDVRRVSYLLNKDSFIVDVGGFNGDWAMRMYCKYSCNIEVFEPQPNLAEAASRNFYGNPKVIVHQMGLGDKYENIDFYGENMNASRFKFSQKTIYNVHIARASSYFNDHYKNKIIDLLKINVEGSEYRIMYDLLKNYDMKKIKNLQIQFHSNVPNHKKQKHVIRQILSKTHKIDWCYDDIFESWSLKN